MLAKAFAQLLIQEKISVENIERALLRFHLLSLLPSILAELKQYQKERIEKETVYIESPFPLTDENKESITKMLQVENKAVHTKENKALLAGFRAHYKETMIDSSMQRIITTFINH